MVDVSEKIENNSDSSELSHNVDKFGENLSGSYYYKNTNLIVWVEILLVYMYLFSDASNDCLGSICENVDMVEVKNKTSKFDDLLSVFKIDDVVGPKDDQTTFQS